MSLSGTYNQSQIAGTYAPVEMTASMIVVEGVHAAHQFAQDERRPARDEDFGRLRPEKLTVAEWHRCIEATVA